MRLVDAERAIRQLMIRVENLRLGSTDPNKVEVNLSLEELSALHVASRAMKRLVDAKGALRSLMFAILGKDELNQESLFEEKDGGS